MTYKEAGERVNGHSQMTLDERKKIIQMAKDVREFILARGGARDVASCLNGDIFRLETSIEGLSK